MLPGANAMEVAERVKEAMDEISKNFPEGLSYEIPFDMTTYISCLLYTSYSIFCMVIRSGKMKKHIKNISLLFVVLIIL